MQYACALFQFLCVEAHYFRIAADNGTAVAVKGVQAFLALAGNAGIKNVRDFFLYKPVHMTVRQLGRKAHSLGGH